MPILLAGEIDAAEHAEWVRCLRAALPEEQIVTDRAGVGPDDIDIAIVANPAAGALDGLRRLQFIQSLWAGVDRLMRDTTIPPGVPVARMVDPSMNDAMAQTALWAVLALHRGFFTYARQQREAQWIQHAQARADELSVAVLGLGEMGRTVATRLASNGYRVIGWSRTPAPVAQVPAQHGIDGLTRVLREADVVINLLPLTNETHGLFDATRFALMRAGAAFVNLARGAHVVDTDLLAALDSGRLGHAVLDVFQAEPLSKGHAFWRHERVTVLPHVAAQTDPRSASEVVAHNVRAVRAGQAPQHLVDRRRGY